jgi:hydroxylamine reductase
LVFSCLFGVLAGTGCFTVGVCGKDDVTAATQDALVHQLKGIGHWATEIRKRGGEVDADSNAFTIKAAFSTLTNVNFDSASIAGFSKQAEAVRAALQAQAEAAGATVAGAPEAATWSPSGFDAETVATAGRTVGLGPRQEAMGGDSALDLFSALEMTMYGLKGAAAYAAHALETGEASPEVFARLHKVLAELAKGKDAGDGTVGGALGLALEVGAINVDVMGMLDQGHRTKFGEPGPSVVKHTPTAGKAILVSGHDLVDLEALLQQVEGTDVMVYTHGEMLPAHGYPGLSKYANLAGHYGGPWNLQQFEWRKFPGPIVVTTNCIMQPQKSYQDRLYTMNEVAWPGVGAVEGRDFSKVIAQAKACDGYAETAPDGKSSITGFGHGAVLGAAPTLLKAIEDGGLKKLVLIGGCDGAEAERSWFTEFAQALPEEAAILTLGCGKYRVLGKVGDGNIPGTEIPRVIDMGQCNDSFSAVAVALELSKVLGCGVNDLPLSINLSWLEQKAVAVLLSLLHLNIKGIRVGPAAPAFVTPAILEVLQTNYDLKLVNPATAVEDAAEVMRA